MKIITLVTELNNYKLNERRYMRDSGKYDFQDDMHFMLKKENEV
jgi:hypothetical protein